MRQGRFAGEDKSFVISPPDLISFLVIRSCDTLRARFRRGWISKIKKRQF